MRCNNFSTSPVRLAVNRLESREVADASPVSTVTVRLHITTTDAQHVSVQTDDIILIDISTHTAILTDENDPSHTDVQLVGVMAVDGSEVFSLPAFADGTVVQFNLSQADEIGDRTITFFGRQSGDGSQLTPPRQRGTYFESWISATQNL